MKNFVLIGFAGCGKSTAGKRAAKKLHLPFYDTDLEIEKAQGRTITEIFAAEGADTFRALETDMAAQLAEHPHCIIATGGGIVTIPRNMPILKANSIVIYMKATPEKILSNIGHNTSRPLLQTDDKEGAVRRLMEERLPLYEQYADVTIDISALTRDESVSALTKLIRRFLRSEAL